KLGGPASLDVERVKAVREAVGDSVRIRVDVNQAWSLREAS
ncbi:MAG TPA: dipeptide epimerase, partial [Pyrodictiaceae archaeon]|nr:dipeptide epimerase [Pyrodictiaceae archaeon]